MKRYLLLAETKKIIDTAKEDSNLLGTTNMELLYSSIDEKSNVITFYWKSILQDGAWTQFDFKVEKESDNILDLVEVGDLVEIPSTIIRVDRITQAGAFETLAARVYSSVTAIYKKGNDGNSEIFTRYGVEKNA